MQFDERKQFLAQNPPFSHLSEKGLDQALKQMHIGHAKAGETLTYSADAAILVLRTGSVELRTLDGSLFDRLSGGDCILFPRSSNNAWQSAHCLEDSLLYFFEESLVDSLGDERSVLQDFFHASTETRLSRVMTQRERNYCLNQRASELMVSNIIGCEAEDSIQEAAKKNVGGKGIVFAGA